ncbi:hypothetical protein [Chelatococcus asaccharovorans]|uniref:hypothetical protein n=1 Tax=Chelatococcus asaccharovorans TaxID=28210 RepID=UPI000D761CB4|nr:hypothetical protein [Chelatococcus asaccharovorans]
MTATIDRSRLESDHAQSVAASARQAHGHTWTSAIVILVAQRAHHLDELVELRINLAPQGAEAQKFFLIGPTRGPIGEAEYRHERIPVIALSSQ